MENTNKNSSYTQTLKISKKVIKLINEFNCFYVFISVFTMVTQGMLPSVLVLIGQRIINSLQQGHCTLKYILELGLIYLICVVIGEVLMHIYTYYTNTISLKLNKAINVNMMEKVAKLNIENFDDCEIYDMINRAQTQSGSSFLTYITQMLEVLKSVVTVISMLIILIEYRWWMAVIIIILPVIKCIMTIRIDNEWYNIKIERTAKERKAWYINFLLTTGNACKEILLLGIKTYLINRYKCIQDDIIAQDNQMNKKTVFIGMSFELGDIAILGCMYAYTLIQGFIGNILIGQIYAYLESITNVRDNLNGVFTQVSNIVQQSFYINLYFQLMELEESDISAGIKVNSIEKIEMKDVSYRYYGHEEYALENINITLKRGQAIGIIGKNGSGKSTLIKIILGLYNNYEGVILVNGIDMKDLDKRSYYKNIGCLFQDYVRFEGTVRENIGYGNLGIIDKEFELLKIIDEMRLRTILDSSEGVDTTVGKWFGCELSGGEWQRLAIARAIVKDTSILILDEPDSSIDIDKQLELMDVYKNNLANKIGIYITHKVTSVHHIANKIYVLDKGKIIEAGSHDKLFKENGQYKKMYEKNIYLS